MLTLLKLELEKLFRAKSFYLSFLVLVGFVALMLWMEQVKSSGMTWH